MSSCDVSVAVVAMVRVHMGSGEGEVKQTSITAKVYDALTCE